MSASEDLRHPFPYLRLAVTQDYDRIQDTIDKRYHMERQYENRPGMTARYHKFCENVALIAAHNLATGYVVVRSQVDQIVERCLEPYEAQLLAMVQPHGNMIHPRQIQHLLDHAKKWGIDEKVVQPYFDRVIQKHGIRITSDKPPPLPKVPPKPVENLEAEASPGIVRLRWQLPSKNWDKLFVCRSETGTPDFKDRVAELRGVEWIDNKVEPGRTYHYAVYSAFGDSDPLASKTVTVHSRGAIMGFQATAHGRRAVLEWQLPPNTERLSLLRSGSAIPEVTDQRGRLRPLPGIKQTPLNKSDQQHRDDDIDLGESYYYVVVARHANGVYSASECRCISFGRGPPAPQGLGCTVVAGRIYVKWEPAGVAKASYLLARSETADPRAKGGNRVTRRLGSNTYEDVDVEAGRVYWYFVATEAGGLASRQPAGVGPVLAVAEVQDLNAEVKPGQVELTWRPPARVHRVEIRRGAGRVPPPPDAKDVSPRDRGTLLAASEAGRFVDSGLVNDATYGYRVSCVFKHPDGSEVITRGEAITATPCDVPELVRGLEAEADKGMKLSWKNPERMQVIILRAGRRPSLRVGDGIAIGDLESHGTRLGHVGVTAVHDPAPDPKKPCYLVFSANRFRAVYCGFACYAEITSLAVRVEKSNIVVRWLWPPGCRGAEVSWQTSSEGETQDTKATEVVRSESSREGSLVLPVSRAAQYRFHVKCLPSSGGAPVACGPGKTESVSVGSANRIDWRFRRPWQRWIGIRKAPTLVIKPNGDLPKMISLRLVGKVNQCPESMTDGRCLAEWRSQPPPNDAGIIEMRVQDWRVAHGKVYCLLFAEPSGSVTIVHPSFEEMLLYRH